MSITYRTASVTDFDVLYPVVEKLHAQSVFSDYPIDKLSVLRTFVTAITFDTGFTQVAERNGVIVGAVVGIMSLNQIGLMCAQDLFTYSKGGTDKMIKCFIQWAQENGCAFVQISEYSDSNRYRHLLNAVGLRPAGLNFIKVF